MDHLGGVGEGRGYRILARAGLQDLWVGGGERKQTTRGWKSEVAVASLQGGWTVTVAGLAAGRLRSGAARGQPSHLRLAELGAVGGGRLKTALRPLLEHRVLKFAPQHPASGLHRADVQPDLEARRNLERRPSPSLQSARRQPGTETR